MDDALETALMVMADDGGPVPDPRPPKKVRKVLVFVPANPTKEN